jgi:hypothetical protein
MQPIIYPMKNAALVGARLAGDGVLEIAIASKLCSYIKVKRAMPLTR